MTNNKKCSVKNCQFEVVVQVRDIKTRKIRNSCRTHMTIDDLVISRYDAGDKELVEKKVKST